MSNSKKKRVVIIGGLGFLGIHLTKIFAEKNFKVVVLDSIKKPKNFFGHQYLKINICEEKQISKVLKKGDLVYHFAAIADIKDANRNLYKTIKTNILGTANVLEACVKKKINKLIFSSSIYALSEQGGIYSSSKLSSELIIQRYSKKFNLNYCILRFGSLYGENFNSFNSIGNLILQGIKNKKIIRKSSGNEIRNYIHVKDAIKICYKIRDKKYKNKCFNLIGNQKLKIREVIEIIKKYTGAKKVNYNTSENFEDHYKVNPFTFKLNNGIFLNLKKNIPIKKGIKDLVLKIKNEQKT